MRLRQNPEFDTEFLEDQEKDWTTVSWWGNKCAALKTRESDEIANVKRLKSTLVTFFVVGLGLIGVDAFEFVHFDETQ